MTDLCRLTFLALFAGLMAPGLASGEPIGGESERAQPAGPEPIEVYVLSRQLASYGLAGRDAAAMILAARMQMSVRASKTDFGGQVSNPSSRSGVPMSRGERIASYLDHAEQFAGANQAQRMEIRALRALTEKDVLSHDYATGPLRHGRWLAPGAEWRFEVFVADGEPVMLAAIGDGDAVVRLLVEGEKGQRVTAVPPTDFIAVVEWMPEYERRFLVRVTNSGSVDSYVEVYSD